MILALVLLFGCEQLAIAQPGQFSKLKDEVSSPLHWRMIGPFRAGRTVGASGIPSQPNVFYIGVNNGGVWKTDDYGRTWLPIFDDQPTGSIGDLAVSLSNPDVIYVGTGEGLHRPDLAVGNGMYRSRNGGKSWTHIGLEDVQQVASVVVHPTDANVVYVGALGHPYGPNETRGVYRSTDGGDTWERVLYIDENTGAAAVTMDPVNPEVLYADFWSHQEGPWENAVWSGSESGLYKSIDGGSSWVQLAGGLPGASQGLGRIGIGIAPSMPDRIYATVSANPGGGIYRSDDAGESWEIVSTQSRLWGRGNDFAEIKVHPTNPDVVFVGNIASYRSEDAGATWSSIKGAPGGDDYHRIWINPLQPDIMLFATDQGATITVNGGRTWRSWYNQPTSQLYHVTTDDQFPYNVYGGQQESGAIKISSRGNGGQVTFRDWVGVGADEYAYVAPDPRDPNVVYGGRVVRHNVRTGQTQNVAPEALRSGKYRIKRTMPLLFHPADASTLLFGTNVVFRTRNGGDSWDVISPDLSRPEPAIPTSFALYDGSAERAGVVYSLAGSPLSSDVIWAGTDDGLVHVTKDGGVSWIDVTPPQMESWDKVAQVDAGHFDQETAYIAVNAIRKDDMRPHIYRTHDFGVTWQRIVSGMDEFGPVNAVREDPRKEGLIYAATEQQVWYSLDDGARWTSLRNNMPATSIRDLVVHENDLVVGTHGRGVWILDNIAPLRELAVALESTRPFLFEPVLATRVRWNMYSDTPLPPEEPGGENPPDGIQLDYLLQDSVDSLALTIVTSDGEVVRRFADGDLPRSIDSTALAHPTYWIRPAQQLFTEIGLHRFVWDLRYPPPADADASFSIAAVKNRTPAGPLGPFVPAGSYVVRLDTPSGSMERNVEVRMDPRVTASAADIRIQDELSKELYDTYHTINRLSLSLTATANAASDLLDGTLSRRNRQRVEETRTEALELRGGGMPGDQDIVYGSITSVPADEENVVALQEKLIFVLNLLQAADARPTGQAIGAVTKLRETAGVLSQRVLEFDEAAAALIERLKE